MMSPNHTHQEKAWTIPCEELDHVVVARLDELTRYDSGLVQRLREQWNQRKSSDTNEINVLEEQLGKADAQIRRLDKLLTDPAAPLSPETERRYLEMLRDAERDRQRFAQKLMQQETLVDPVRVIPNFYHVLGDFRAELSRLAPASQKRLIRQVVQEVKLSNLSLHLMQLHISWQNGLATCPDVALIWRGMSGKVEQEWADEEDTVMRELYPTAEQDEIMRSLPLRAWDRIYDRAQVLKLRRMVSHKGPHPFNKYHRTLAYSDLEAAASLVSSSSHKDRVRNVVNDMARRTVRGGLTAHWWLPLHQISYAN